MCAFALCECQAANTIIYRSVRIRGPVIDEQLARFGDRLIGRGIGIDADRRNERVVPHVTVQRSSEAAHPGGSVRREIEDRIPIPARDRIEVGVPIPDQSLNGGGKIRVRATAAEYRHSVSAGDRRAHEKRAYASRSAENQNA